MAGAAAAGTEAVSGFRATGVVFSAVDDLSAGVQQTGDSEDEAAARGSAHGASDERLESKTNRAVAVAPKLHWRTWWGITIQGRSAPSKSYTKV